MIDVIFLLIIFFMTTAQFAQMTRAELDLPIEPGEGNAVSDEAGLVVNLTREGRIIVNDRTLTLEELDSRIVRFMSDAQSRGEHKQSLTLRADRDADSARLNELIRLMQDLGIPAARVATEVPR